MGRRHFQTIRVNIEKKGKVKNEVKCIVVSAVENVRRLAQ